MDRRPIWLTCSSHPVVSSNRSTAHELERSRARSLLAGMAWQARDQRRRNDWKSVRDQAERISRCRLTFHLSGTAGIGLVNQNIVDRALFIEEGSEKQGRLSLETAKLSEGFFEQLKKHPVPLEEAAIKALSNNAPALDAYLWLAYRLHVLKGTALLPGLL